MPGGLWRLAGVSKLGAAHCWTCPFSSLCVLWLEGRSAYCNRFTPASSQAIIWSRQKRSTVRHGQTAASYNLLLPSIKNYNNTYYSACVSVLLYRVFYGSPATVIGRAGGLRWQRGIEQRLSLIELFTADWLEQ